MLLLSFCAAACSNKPPATFDLDPAADFAHERAPRGQLAVEEPAAGAPLDSNRIVIRTGPDSIAYLTGARWAERLPRLVQSRLIESFENAHVFGAVGPLGLDADRTLKTEIRRFEADVAADQAHVEISASIVAANGRVVANKIFSAYAPEPGDAPKVVVGALDKALSHVLHEIVVWAAKA